VVISGDLAYNFRERVTDAAAEAAITARVAEVLANQGPDHQGSEGR